jgi:mRNA-degrading endonuclease RelE of RelBE toxin-antitoxin system
MYKVVYSIEIVKKLLKIKKKDKNQYIIIKNKINQIANNPNHNYKYLHHNMKKINRVHLGHFVLIFRINHELNLISFEDYEHHDKIYE